MDIQTTTFHSARVLQLAGELDAQSVNQVEQQFPTGLWGDSRYVAIDLTAVNFIDSSGVGMLVFLVKRLWAAGRQVCLVGLQGQPARLISMLRIEQSIPCYESVSAFVSAKAIQSDDQPIVR